MKKGIVYVPNAILWNTYAHCGYCKKRALHQDFEDEEAEAQDLYRCPNCGRLLKRIYFNREEQELNEPIREKNLKEFLKELKRSEKEKNETPCLIENIFPA